MKTTEECTPEVERAEQPIDIPKLIIANRILGPFSLGILLYVLGVFVCSYLCLYRREDPIYGNHFPFTPLYMALCFPLVLFFSGFLANFRRGKPKRFVREVILWLIFLYAAFGLHCLAAYFFYGDGMVFCAVVKGFSERMLYFSIIFAAAIYFLVGDALGFALIRRSKRIQDKITKKGVKSRRGSVLFRMVDGFVDGNPTLIVTRLREYCCQYVRYAIRGTLLSLLVLETMIAFHFGVYSLAKRLVPAYDPSFELVSFKGEKFGRVLSGDVERKKLDQPIGVIDELMLQTAGNPSRRLMCMYGLKFLGDISAEEANGLAEETCAALQKLIGVKLNSIPLGFRDGFRKGVGSDTAYVQVKWDDHFFQKGKVLRLEVGLRNVGQWNDHWLKVDEVMGYKIGEPVGGDGTPKTPFWKFERVVNQCASNRISDGVYAVHDVSDLKREDAVKELEEARKAVEALHGIKMFKTVDGDDVKQYEYHGDDVDVSVKLEYLREKQIRYAVLAKGEWLGQIHGMPPPGGHSQRSRGNDTLAFLSFMVVVAACIVWLMYRIHRKKRETK